MVDFNPSGLEGNGQIQSPVQVRAITQFIKDLSFENPGIDRMMQAPQENPNIEVQVNVSGRQVGPDVYESQIELSAQAKTATDVIYQIEVIYAGLFQIQNMPQEMLEPFLLINAPTLTFPFLRRLLADITREGGFPPLMLDPIDFGQLFMSRQQNAANNNNPSTFA
jgi:preprotein translocase subunit SecB